MLFAKVIIYFDMAMKYAEKHNETPRQERRILSGRWGGLGISRGGGR